MNTNPSLKDIHMNQKDIVSTDEYVTKLSLFVEDGMSDLLGIDSLIKQLNDQRQNMLKRVVHNSDLLNNIINNSAAYNVSDYEYSKAKRMIALVKDYLYNGQ